MTDLSRFPASPSKEGQESTSANSQNVRHVRSAARKWVNAVFLVALAVISVIPLTQMIFHWAPDYPLDERRQLHPFPDLRAFETLDPQVGAKLNQWFDDNYGFRDLLIRTKNEIDFQLFSTSKKVVVGKDGFLFQKDLIDQVNNNDRGGVRLVNSIVSTIDELNTCLARRNIKLVFVLNPTKTSIYPDKFPANAVAPAAMGVAQQVAAQLDQQKDLIFIDGQKILADHPSNQLYFHKTDLHMNIFAAQLIYGEMLARIAEYAQKPTPQLRTGRIVYGYWEGGGEARFLSKLWPLGEWNRSFDNAGTRTSDDGGRWLINNGLASMGGDPGLLVFGAKYDNARRDPNLLPPTSPRGHIVFGFDCRPAPAGGFPDDL